jgi:hypothetical protein
MWATYRQPANLTIGAFLFLWNFNQFSMTVLYYHATQTQHNDEQYFGLAARVCRPQTAGTTFALLMSLINLGALLSQGLGGSLYETMTQHWGSAAAFQVLVGIGALSTAGCWLLLPLMRRTLFPQAEPGSAKLELAIDRA